MIRESCGVEENVGTNTEKESSDSYSLFAGKCNERTSVPTSNFTVRIPGLA